MKRNVNYLSSAARDISKLTAVLDLLAAQEQMSKKYKGHPLEGEMLGFRECHIESDWLLIYKVDQSNLFLVAAETGTHSGLFNA